MYGEGAGNGDHFLVQESGCTGAGEILFIFSALSRRHQHSNCSIRGNRRFAEVISRYPVVFWLILFCIRRTLLTPARRPGLGVVHGWSFFFAGDLWRAEDHWIFWYLAQTGAALVKSNAEVFEVSAETAHGTSSRASHRAGA